MRVLAARKGLRFVGLLGEADPSVSQRLKATSLSFITCCLLACSSSDIAAPDVHDADADVAADSGQPPDRDDGTDSGTSDEVDVDSGTSDETDADSGTSDETDADSGTSDETDADSGSTDDVDSGGPDAAVPDIIDDENKDTDCDGLSDAEEFAAVYTDGQKTDPARPDSDGDGILDGVELGRTTSVDTSCVFPGDQDPTTQTSPVLSDTDGDGLPDGIEDADRNGAHEATETHPNAADTDGDNLTDGEEDANANGVVDANETDPRLQDTDGDGIRDDIEIASCTDPRSADSDGDGIPDGVEDANQNGVVDALELDPCDPSDGAIGGVCTSADPGETTFATAEAPDLQLALPADFREALRQPIELDGVSKGLLAWDDTAQVTVLAFERSPSAAESSLSAEEFSLRAAALSNAFVEYTRTFTTWDGYPALTARYSSTDARDLNAFTNALTKLAVPGSTGELASSAGITGPFKIQAQYVRRSDTSLLVTWAIVPASRFDPADNAFVLTDLAAGSSLARADHTNTARCEAFSATNSKVDFLFVVDDSGSMAVSQLALANTANAMAEQLDRAALDWRIAMVTTSYVASGRANSGVVRGFTSNIHQFRAWLTQNSTCAANQCQLVAIPAGASPTSCTSNAHCWIGINGNGTEQPLASARAAINSLASPNGTEATRFRPDADVVVVLLTDARDASSGTVDQYQQYFAGSGAEPGVTQNPLGRLIPVHGIFCPPERTSNDTATWCSWQEDPRNPRHLDVVLANGGVHGSIRSSASVAATVDAIVHSAVAASGHRTTQPALGASLKVALEEVENPALCSTPHDLPRSRTNGFDFDGIEGTVSFFGACRPAQPGTTRAAIHYRAWVE